MVGSPIPHHGASPQSGRRPFRWSDAVFGPPLAALVSGAMEICIFHPFDTASKRLISDEGRARVSALRHPWQRLRTSRDILFHSLPPTASATDKVAHIYKGLKFAALYKVNQRIIKFAGQPMLRDVAGRWQFEAAGAQWGMSKRASRTLMESVCGCIAGVCEIVLLPLDRVKVLTQTNQHALQNRSFFQLITQERGGLYAGATTTAARNALGSFLLFGGTAFAKDAVFGLEDYRQATLFQNLASSAVGATMGVLATSPLDVVKTRIQNKHFGEPLSGRQVATALLREEGPRGFFKGIVPKVIATAPKLVFVYTMTESITRVLRRLQPGGRGGGGLPSSVVHHQVPPTEAAVEHGADAMMLPLAVSRQRC